MIQTSSTSSTLSLKKKETPIGETSNSGQDDFYIAWTRFLNTYNMITSTTTDIKLKIENT